MSRLETKYLDKFFNGYLLKKRQLGKPFKYNVDAPYEISRFYDMVFFPKNKFQKVVSFAFERSLPTLQYFIWNPMTYYARKMGWTEQEKLYHNFWRGSNMMYHSLAQSMHPQAYMERQRADNFIRRVETMLPGIEAPEWTHHARRGVDFDYEGVMNPYRAMNIVDQENTPKPHYGVNYPTAVSHVGNQRYMLGYWAQRLFYNEEIKGNLQRGYYTEDQKKVMDSWYAGQEDSVARDMHKTSEQTQEDIKNANKWINLLETFYPEYKNYKVDATPIKYNEAYYDRTVDDVTNSIFIQKWMTALQSKVFNQSDLQQVYEFFLHQRDDVFWTMSEEDGLYHPTQLYTKFVNALNLPNVFELEKYTSTVVEVQYKNKLQINYGINFNTVEQFRRQHLKFIQELGDTKDLNVNVVRRLRALVSEEVFNPLFRSKVADLAKGAQGSYVVAAFKANGTNVVDQLESVHQQVAEELHFVNKENHNNYLARLRTVVKTFPFIPQKVAEVKF